MSREIEWAKQTCFISFGSFGLVFIFWFTYETRGVRSTRGIQDPRTNALISEFKKNFQKLEISVLAAYLIIFAEIFRFHFFTFLRQPNDCPGKKRVGSHSFICSVHIY